MRRIFVVLCLLAMVSVYADTPAKHPHLSMAQDLITQAFDRISDAQKANEFDMGGHAKKAKNFLDQASQELKLAAVEANPTGGKKMEGKSGASMNQQGTNVSGAKHPNLAAAQQMISDAFMHIGEAQKANEFDLGGHAAKAKDYLEQANAELKLAAQSANN